MERSQCDRAKAALLESVAKNGSITEAAEKMETSYMRAWSLIKTMNGCFKSPLVMVKPRKNPAAEPARAQPEKQRWPFYRKMETDSSKATEISCRKFRNLLGADSICFLKYFPPHDSVASWRIIQDTGLTN
jgi:molybdate transport system regulatory protein